MSKEESFVTVKNELKSDKNKYTFEERREFVINKLRDKKWKDQLKTINLYLDNMMKQIDTAKDINNNSLNKDIVSKDNYPWPMFEIVSNDQNIYSLTKGFPLNFHVLYAEAEILKYLIS